MVHHGEIIVIAWRQMTPFPHQPLDIPLGLLGRGTLMNET